MILVSPRIYHGVRSNPVAGNMKGHPQLHFAAFILSLLAVGCNAHNITSILSGYPEFSIFNEYITRTKVADDVNTRTTITVLVVDDASMSPSPLIDVGLETVQHVLSLHVLLDYLDATKLHSIVSGSMLSTTLFQTSGVAQEMSGFLNITDLKGGTVGFEVPGSNTVAATFVKSIYSDPYNISVIQISNLIAPTGLLAPSIPASSVNISAVLANTGHTIFAHLITATGVLDTYRNIVDGGLTVFAPVDGAFDGFMTEIEKLSSSQQVSVLEFHARPVYSPLGTLKTTDGNVVTTLATNGAERYTLNVSVNGETVTLSTGVNSAEITSTMLDDQPLVVFSIDKVLKPPEIFATAAPPHFRSPAPRHSRPPHSRSPVPSPARSPVPSPAPAPAQALGSPVPVSSAPTPVPVSSAPTPVSSPSSAVPSPSQSVISPPAPPVESPPFVPAPSVALAGESAQSPILEKSSAFHVGIGSLASMLVIVTWCSVTFFNMAVL